MLDTRTKSFKSALMGSVAMAALGCSACAAGPSSVETRSNPPVPGLDRQSLAPVDQAPLRDGSGPRWADGTPLTEQEMAAERTKFLQKIDDGWIPFSAPPGIQGAASPAGFVTTGDHDGRMPDFGELDRVDVFDEPNGKVIGYYYRSLGFVSVADAASPGFDPAVARVEMFGCDPDVASCAARLKADQP